VDIPTIESLKELQPGDELRARRKILMYWAILHRAGYRPDEAKLKKLMRIDPHINEKTRESIYGKKLSDCPVINSIDALATELEKCADADRQAKLKSSSGKDLFDADDQGILGFLKPTSTVSSGPGIIQGFALSAA
jgi:hypothetical protein